MAHIVKGIADGYNGGSSDGITFIIHGYSAGGIVPALRLSGAKQPDSLYRPVGCGVLPWGHRLSDAHTRFAGYHLSENYYQTYENSPSVDEIHDQITAAGWTNLRINLGPDESWGFKKNYHDRAVAAADATIFEKMKDIIKNDQ